VTEPKALRSLCSLFASRPGNLFLIDPKKSTYHPKLYCFYHDKSVEIISGSANLTSGGLTSNTEASVVFTVRDGHPILESIRQFKASLEGDSNQADAWNIGQYDARYRVFKKYRDRSVKEAADSINNQEKFSQVNLERLMQKLGEYQLDAGQQKSYRERTANYKKALTIIAKLCDDKIDSPEAFENLYGLLVGADGVGHLWHSGGLFRTRSQVTKNYKKVILLIRKLRDAKTAVPREVFEIGMKEKSGVQGLGVNILTEIMNTLAPDTFPILNKNQLEALRFLGHPKFKPPNSYEPADYELFSELQSNLKKRCNFKSFGKLDHFLNTVYWKSKGQ